MKTPIIHFAIEIVMFCLLIGAGNATPGNVRLPSDRLRYDRSKAKGPLVRGSTVTRRSYSSADKPKTDSSYAVPVTAPTPVAGPPVAPVAPMQYNPLKPLTVKCKVTENMDSTTSPVIEIRGVRGLFNSVLVGYQNPESLTRENKGSFFGWSTAVNAPRGQKVHFTFNANFVPIRPKINPTTYCALIIQPPLMPSPETFEAFKTPPRSAKRSLTSTDSLAKFLKGKQSSIVASCCFLAQTTLDSYDSV
ncbi:hypothetical protein, conserved [Babesia bigemina]|uniref:Uncharacterized protein n=1 Tax=Babesia bigemina TaxID=5866 RepID=A0A061D6V0_BABBI|nr:hypothetical protein, conserved [Babesia bigemina]CDR96263.1 hypothetical protein, conserved [Babesia bigemina]|eukprot:XP_012768449.1 hypothetical protein, conserved [Babesia bigemina]